MYYYLYDTSLSEKKYSTIVAKIENRLTDLGINGKINRLSFLKNISQILKEEINRGVKTIVAVGNDKTLCQTINLTADLDVVLGYIPVESTGLSEMLNIPGGEKACDALSARIIKTLDLAQINGHYFIGSVETGGSPLTLNCDNNYFINLDTKKNKVAIANLGYYYQQLASCDDQTLNIFIETKEKKLFKKAQIYLTKLKAKKVVITSDKALPILATDEKIIIKTPAEIKIIPKKLKLITGKNKFC